ncbi:MAG TPA: DNA-binding response regulator, partial [Vicinamibacteria bacterium]
MSARTRVLIADDHELFRDGIEALLSAESDLVVVGEARNGREAVEKALR